MKASYRACLCSLCALLTVRSVAAQSTSFADQLIGAYSKLESYCDRGREYESSSGGTSTDAAREFEHCVLKDGRYKTTTRDLNSLRGFKIGWSDGEFERYYIFVGGERSFDSYGKVSNLNWPAPTDIPPLVRSVLGRYWLTAVDLVALRQRLDAFEPKAELSTADLAGYETTESNVDLRQRLWISPQDGLIRRVAWHNERVGGIEATEVRIDEPVAPEKLTFEPPTSAVWSYWAKKHAFEIAAAISALSFIVGLGYWRIRWRTRASDAAVFAARRRHWSIYRKFLWTLIPVFAFALFAPTGGDMSGAALLIERIGWALLYVYVLWLVALFMAARHWVETPATVTDL